MNMQTDLFGGLGHRSDCSVGVEKLEAEGNGGYAHQICFVDRTVDRLTFYRK